MKSFKIVSLLSVLALALAPSLKAQTQPFVTPTLTDTLTIVHEDPDSTVMRPVITLQQLATLVNSNELPGSGIWSLIVGPSGSLTVNAGALFTIPGNELGFSPSLGIGSSAVQATSKSTGVTVNAETGSVTMNNASLASATAVSFTLTNARIIAGDVLAISTTVASTASHAYLFGAQTANGSALVTVMNVSGSTQTDALVLDFVDVHAVNN